jgi:hypothetical protein
MTARLRGSTIAFPGTSPPRQAGKRANQNPSRACRTGQNPPRNRLARGRAAHLRQFDQFRRHHIGHHIGNKVARCGVDFDPLVGPPA